MELGSNEPIAFANIGIKNTRYGSTSFEDGTFSIFVPEILTDSLSFRVLGYKDTAIVISQLVNGSTDIYLEPRATVLEEVVVTNDFVLEGRQGLKNAGSSGIQFASEDGGAAMAILLNEEGEEWLLTSASIFIHENELDSFMLKCKIMSMDNGKPHEDLINRNIIIESTIDRGEIKVNLADNNLYLDQPFFLVFEWILSKSTADYYDYIADNRPDWWPEGTGIHDRKYIVFYDKEGKVTRKIKLTKEQRKEYEQLRHRSTAFSIKGDSYKTMFKESSMSEWIQFGKSLVANVNYLSKTSKE